MVAALWWGSLTTLGFLVVPQLFAHLASPVMAGAMAARLFTAQTWLSVVCTMLLLMIVNKQSLDTAAGPPVWAKPAVKLILAGLLLALLANFAVAPRIVSARSEGGNLKLWHALGSAMYLVQWMLATGTLWLASSPARAEASGEEGRQSL